MLAARDATSSATKRRTRPTSSALGALSPRIVTGPASTQLHLYLPRQPADTSTLRVISSVKRCASLHQKLEDVLGYGAHLAALVGDLDIRARPQLLLVDLGDGVGNSD